MKIKYTICYNITEKKLILLSSTIFCIRQCKIYIVNIQFSYILLKLLYIVFRQQEATKEYAVSNNRLW